MTEDIVGFGEPLGIYISKEELKLVKEAIALRDLSTTVTFNPRDGARVKRGDSKDVEDLVEDLRKAHNLPEGKYGINQWGEFVLFRPIN